MRDVIPIAPTIEQATTARQQENVRQAIALCLVGLFVAEIAAFMAMFWFQKPGGADGFADLKELMGLILTPTTALVGAATGFYYGGRSGGG